MERLTASILVLALVLVVTPSIAQLSYPGTEDFETDPFVDRWTADPGPGTAEWSTAQAHSGSGALHMARDAGYGDTPVAYTDISSCPQTGEVEVSFWMYYAEEPAMDNACQFGHFGNTATQITDGYKIVTLAFLDQGAGYQLKMYNANGWSMPDPPLTIGDLTFQWVRHRVVFDQDNLTCDWYVQIGDGGTETLYLADQPTHGTKVGDPSFPYFTSIPFCNSDYYIDDFTLGTAQQPEPTATPVPGVVTGVNEWAYE